jgi:hypothetical protein
MEINCRETNNNSGKPRRERKIDRISTNTAAAQMRRGWAVGSSAA